MQNAPLLMILPSSALHLPQVLEGSAAHKEVFCACAVDWSTELTRIAPFLRSMASSDFRRLWKKKERKWILKKFGNLQMGNHKISVHTLHVTWKRMPLGKSGIKIGLHSERTMKGHGHKMMVKMLKYPIFFLKYIFAISRFRAASTQKGPE